MLRWLPRLFSRDMGIDLGTANTLVYVKGQGIVLCEPSVVAIDSRGQVKAVGSEAKKMLGRTPGNIKAIRPMRDGVIADFEVTEAMLRYFIRKAQNRRMLRPWIIISVPSGITSVEKRAVRDSALRAGASHAYLMAEPMAAAIGAGMPIEEAVGNMIVDIGGGTTEVAVISLSGDVVSKSLRIAGDEMDEAIMAYVRRNFNLLIGSRSAEQIKIRVGSADKLEQELTTVVKGRDLVSGLPKTVDISSVEVREALTEPVNSIVDIVKDTLEETPPELAADIMERGIMMSGGGALLRGFPNLLARCTGITIHLADDPLTSVVLGTGRALDEFDRLRDVLESSTNI